MTVPKPSNRTVYIALGSNLDNPVDQVRTGIASWQAHPDTTLLAASSLYRTPPWGVTDQPDFINAVIAINTPLEPDDLLKICKRIEQAQHRQTTYRWGPRTLDCDIIHIVGISWADDQLTLPHQHWSGRAFVVLPLLEIAPDLEIGTLSVSLAAERLSAEDRAGIHRLTSSSTSEQA